MVITANNYLLSASTNHLLVPAHKEQPPGSTPIVIKPSPTQLSWKICINSSRITPHPRFHAPATYLKPVPATIHATIERTTRNVHLHPAFPVSFISDCPPCYLLTVVAPSDHTLNIRSLWFGCKERLSWLIVGGSSVQASLPFLPQIVSLYRCLLGFEPLPQGINVGAVQLLPDSATLSSQGWWWCG